MKKTPFLGCSGASSINQAAFELRDVPVSAFHVLGLKTCATTAWPKAQFIKLIQLNLDLQYVFLKNTWVMKNLTFP